MFWQLMITITFTVSTGTTSLSLLGFRGQAACQTYASDLRTRIEQAPKPLQLNNDPRLTIKSIELQCEPENQV